MDTAVDEFVTKMICNRIRQNRPIELAEIKLTTKQLKHLQKCKSQICETAKNVK